MAQNNSNFSFLADNWAFLLQEAQRVEAFALTDPRTAAFYARRTLELSLKWLYQNDTALKAPYEKSLAAMIHEPTFASNVKDGLRHDIKYIHKLGNLAVHHDQPISTQEGLQATRALHTFLGWLARVYTRGSAKPGRFQASLLPKAEDTKQKSTDQLKEIQDTLKKKDEEATLAQSQLSKTEEQLKDLKEELKLLQSVKSENEKTIGSSEYTEAETRDAIIDVMLREAGWNPKGKDVEEYPVKGLPTKDGKNDGDGFVDYVLWGNDKKPLAVVEAKKTKVDPKVGKRQAELYADCLEEMTGQRPIIYYTNGYKTWLWDDTFYPPREVEGYATQDELQWSINRRASRKDLTTLQPKKEIVERVYQHEAAASIMKSYGADRRRKSLIVMATGSGKTRLAIALVDMLMRGNWIRRTLFLADRIALVNQAKREFNKHLPHASVVSLLDKTEEDARVIFSTYPTMLNCIDGTRKDQKEQFSVGHFDLIIIDEAHRSVYQKYGAIFDYFDSLLLGLTATPRGDVDRNTYRLFELEDYRPTFAYELTQAIEDEYLVPAVPLSVPLKFLREGIKYDELSPEEQEEYELEEQFYDQETGAMITEIGSSELNKWLFNKNTVNQVLMHIMEDGIKVEGGDKLGKTIIFAKNTKHAEFIVEQFDMNYPHLKGKFCRKIDYSVKYAQSLIDDFSIKEKDPYIVVSVDMLDTGIDVPEIVNLVFFKLIRSKTKFWQMVGRGTRLCLDLFGPGDDKEEFYIFDYCQNLEFFGANPDGGREPALQESVKQKIFKRRLELAVTLQNAQTSDESLAGFCEDLKDQMHEVVNAMDVNNFIIRKHREHVDNFADRKKWANITDKEANILSERISGLPSPDQDNEDARRFDLLIINLQVALLSGSPYEQYQKSIIEIADDLEGKGTIPAVKEQMALILEIQTDAYWQDITLPILEQLRRKLRHLIRFVEVSTKKEDVYTDFEDTLDRGDIETIDIVQRDPKLKSYYKRVKRFILEHQDHITIRRLKNNKPVSHTDIIALEDILFSEDGPIPRQEYEKIFGEKPLSLLVRTTVGLDKQAAKEAFAEFLGKAPLHQEQIAFLDEVIGYLMKNGVMEPKVLFDTPFTHHHDNGVVGIFGDVSSQEVIEVINKINENAEVA